MKGLTQCLEWSTALNSRSAYHCSVLPLSLLRCGRQWWWSQPDCSGGPISPCPPQGSSSSDSLEGQSCDYASKSYDAVVFDVLKVTPEEFAVSVRTDVGGWAPPQEARGWGVGWWWLLTVVCSTWKQPKYCWIKCSLWILHESHGALKKDAIWVGGGRN